ncbi:hypothetical protein ANT2_3381 [plant metagenome]|uniref:Uncharacterized protein n=1 Tax=plant metagenome TaxID=1297885 RepID=A0A484SZY7_9ZZZZ
MLGGQRCEGNIHCGGLLPGWWERRPDWPPACGNDPRKRR